MVQRRTVISLHPDQEAWLQMRVASGGFVSIEDAVRQLIDNQIVQQRELENDDLAWAKPLEHDAIKRNRLIVESCSIF